MRFLIGNPGIRLYQVSGKCKRNGGRLCQVLSNCVRKHKHLSYVRFVDKSDLHPDSYAHVLVQELSLFPIEAFTCSTAQSSQADFPAC